MKKLVIFDLDGTLAESKAAIDPEMGILLTNLLRVTKVAVISGGSWQQFQNQLLAHLVEDDSLKNLSLLPVCGTKFYTYKSGWNLLYSEDFTVEEKDKIITALTTVIAQAGFTPQKTWGELIEDRGSQVTYSALGQLAPLEAKKSWDADFSKRKVMKPLLEKLIPEFAINLGGTTSIDITKPGIDKAYGIAKLENILRLTAPEIIFIGDAIFPDGNDFPAVRTGVTTIHVKDVHETKRVIETIVACLS
jgi:HAD superfamily hydrolase (TIGR01484 family)